MSNYYYNYIRVCRRKLVIKLGVFAFFTDELISLTTDKPPPATLKGVHQWDMDLTMAMTMTAKGVRGLLLVCITYQEPRMAACAYKPNTHPVWSHREVS